MLVISLHSDRLKRPPPDIENEIQVGDGKLDKERLAVSENSLRLITRLCFSSYVTSNANPCSDEKVFGMYKIRTC